MGNERETSILEMYRLRAVNEKGYELFDKLEKPEVIDAFYNERFGRNDPLDYTLNERKEDERTIWMNGVETQMKEAERMKTI